MILEDFHVHSTYCDGKNTLEEMVQAALKLNFCSLGFSGHGFTDGDNSYCMKDTAAYIHEVKTLRQKYKDEIEIYLGVEEDAICFVDRSKFDYIIGSSHYYRTPKGLYAVDNTPDTLKECLKHFNNDPIALAENYFSHFCTYINSRRPDIIGHFDLISKFNEGGRLFDENHPRYVAAYTAAIDRLLPSQRSS